MKKIYTTLLLLRQDNKILLGLKKRGFGEGKYNGVGGKLRPGETAEQAMKRECFEEIGVVPTLYEKVGLVDFIEFYKGEQARLVFNLYIATEWEGEICESNEIKPFWFDIDKIPYDNMFEDDKYWLPMVLEGKKIAGYFEFDKDFKLMSYSLTEI